MENKKSTAMERVAIDNENSLHKSEVSKHSASCGGWGGFAQSEGSGIYLVARRPGAGARYLPAYIWVSSLRGNHIRVFVCVRVQHDDCLLFREARGDQSATSKAQKLKVVSRFLALCVRRLHLAQVCVRRTDSPLRASFASTACRHPSRPGPGEKGGWMLGKKGDRMRTLDSAAR